ncbi:MAG: hypothetical protein AB1510_02260 [Bacillota bacterium]
MTIIDERTQIVSRKTLKSQAPRQRLGFEETGPGQLDIKADINSKEFVLMCAEGMVSFIKNLKEAGII